MAFDAHIQPRDLLDFKAPQLEALIAERARRERDLG
jgi:hypothetical protein